MKKRMLALFLALALLMAACGHAEPSETTGTVGSDTTQSTALTGDSATTGEETLEQAAGTTANTAGGTGSSGTSATSGCKSHTDADDNGTCDSCGTSVMVSFDFYVVNDLHGKVADSDTQPGVDELTTYFKNARKTDDNVVILSAGDMWQGSSESNLTNGLLVTEWMNAANFGAMVMGNHEYDWGESLIQENYKLAKFPFLGINIYNRATNNRVDYCKSSTVVTGDGVQIGIIGAIGDCYSSISADKVTDIYFKTGKALTELVKAESQRLRNQGADYIVYLLHDGYEQSKGSSVTNVAGNQLSYYYDIALSEGYVDLVFEAHTHQRYILKDEHGVYHMQNGGENKGISHVEVAINSLTGSNRVTEANLVTSGEYARLADDPIVQQLLNKYDSQVSVGTKVLGNNASNRNSRFLAQLVADQYYKAGMEIWGKEYDIVLGGGFISVRSPYTLDAGSVTYGDLQTLFPFDNDLVLCSIKGRDLKTRFFETDNDRYYLAYGDYGQQVKNNIDPNATYYVVVDSYTSVYGPNKLTEVARYGEKLYARDLLAQYIKDGGLA